MASPITLSYLEAQTVGETLQPSCSSSAFFETLMDGTGHWFGHIYENTRCGAGQLDQSQTEFELTSALQFGASSYLLPENRFSITVSIGTYIALQDTVFRSLCSQNFFNPQKGDYHYRRRWKGGSVVAAPEFFPPRLRYYDYSPTTNVPVKSVVMMFREAGFEFSERWEAPWLGQFLTRVPPYGERLLLAEPILQIAMAFIFLHEECHFQEGHLQYKRDNFGNLSARAKKRTLRSFEYQADKAACQGILDTLFVRELNSSLPPHARSDWTFLLRLILTSIGLVFVICDIGRRERGESFFQTPFQRLVGAFKSIQGLIAKNEGYFKRQRYDLRLGLNTTQNMHKRAHYAIQGALRDLTEAQTVMAAHTPRVAAELWPLDEAFPYMAVGPIVWGSRQDYPESFGEALSETDERIAESCAADFQITVDRAISYRDIALREIAELRRLIEESNSLLEKTASYRRWSDSKM